MSVPERIDTHQKALSINLDPKIFGSFAEIGAGQEVARWFLQVGAASGTVAKTISAYDKEVSDDLYGAGTRYVSKPRLQSMLEREWSDLLSQLSAPRGVALLLSTLSLRQLRRNNECHGWIGIAFRRNPARRYSPHRLRDHGNLAQRAAVGILPSSHLPPFTISAPMDY